MGTLDGVRKKLFSGDNHADGDNPNGTRSRKDPARDAKIRSSEVDERIRRDRILRKIGGRRGQGVGVGPGQDSAQREQKGSLKGHGNFSEGTEIRGDENNEDNDNPDGGEYVNFAVDFSYDGRKNRNGWDLHFLCYTGIGLKGLGGAELRKIPFRRSSYG
jgi:hypothetical protein